MSNIEEKVERLLASVAELVAAGQPVSCQGGDVDEFVVPAAVYLRVADDLAMVAGQRCTCPGCEWWKG